MKKVEPSKIDMGSWFLGAVFGYVLCLQLKVVPMQERADLQQQKHEVNKECSLN